jgi:chromosome segregation ATPase
MKEEKASLHPNNIKSILRLAMLLTIRNTAFRNPRRATRLLQRYVASNPQNTELRQLASLLLHMTADLQQYEAIYRETREKLDENVAERQTQERRYHRVKNQLKEIQSEKQEQQVRTQRVDTELKRERQQVEDLRQKIEQLKTIEKTITERKKDLQPAT